MALLRPTPTTYRRFTWSSEDGVLSAELSDLGQPLGRVWDDACDTGLTVIGIRHEIVFAVHHEERDAEGELLYLDLLPAELRQRDVGVTVRLYND